MKYYCVKQHDITDCGAACSGNALTQKAGSTRQVTDDINIT